MVNKTRKGQLLWYVTNDNEVLHGYVTGYDKSEKNIKIVLDEGPMNLSERGDEYELISGDRSIFYVTRQEAIEERIGELKKESKALEKELAILLSERKKNSVKDIIYKRPGKHVIKSLRMTMS